MASYGSAEGVASLCRRYTNAGAFDITTNPSLSAVTGWLAQVSSMLNVALATAGFVTPITDADVTPALDGVVNSLVADLASTANSAGRFYSDRALENGVSPIKAINADVRAWVDANAAGLVAMGANRTTSDAGQIAYRETDETGETPDHLFTRDNFGTWSIGR
jgi:hypothetical protein